MTREELIRMADSCESPEWGEWYSDEDALERFAVLVSEHLRYDGIHSCHPECTRPACVAMREAVLAEREACAKVCEARVMGDNNREDEEAKRCAAAIRARGQE